MAAATGETRPGNDVYAISIAGPGGYDVLQLRQFVEPTRGSNCRLTQRGVGDSPHYFASVDESTLVTVDVDFCGVNYADVCIRWGLYSSAKKYNGYPITPGFEFSGTVRSVGASVVGVSVGDAVFGVSMFGSYSTRVCVPQVQVFKPNPGSPFTARDNACWVATFGTAWYALKQANLDSESTILVHSASGGVGSMLVQIAKSRGHTVVGVVGRSAKVAYCRSIGADHVIDKSSQPLWDTAQHFSASYREFRGFHAVFDANGVSTLQESYKYTLPGGKLVVYGFHSMLPKNGGILGLFQWVKLAWLWLKSPTFDPMDLVPANKTVIGFNLSYLFDSVDMLQECVREGQLLASQGAVQPPQVTEYPLHACREAHRAIESGKTIGKLVLNCSATYAAVRRTDSGAALCSPSSNVPKRKWIVPVALAAMLVAGAVWVQQRKAKQRTQSRHTK